jgi:hypothetical protein
MAMTACRRTGQHSGSLAKPPPGSAMTQVHLTGKCALVTGANKGIVFEVARQLGRWVPSS